MMSSDRVDLYARFFFPISFLIFNVILWASYLTMDIDA